MAHKTNDLAHFLTFDDFQLSTGLYDHLYKEWIGKYNAGIDHTKINLSEDEKMRMAFYAGMKAAATTLDNGGRIE